MRAAAAESLYNRHELAINKLFDEIQIIEQHTFKKYKAFLALIYIYIDAEWKVENEK